MTFLLSAFLYFSNAVFYNKNILSSLKSYSQINRRPWQRTVGAGGWATPGDQALLFQTGVYNLTQEIILSGSRLRRLSLVIPESQWEKGPIFHVFALRKQMKWLKHSWLACLASRCVLFVLCSVSKPCGHEYLQTRHLLCFVYSNLSSHVSLTAWSWRHLFGFLIEVKKRK